MTSRPELTPHQALVLETLHASHAPITAYALLDAVRASGIRAPQQVYRALDKLIELGRVHKLDSLNAFVACRHDESHSQGVAAFAICDACGTAQEVSDPALERRLMRWSTELSFGLHSATIELRGRCGDCGGQENAAG